MIKKIKLLNFRNYGHLETTFSPGINIIYGNNAQGKTNLLESIYFLAITKSHRSFVDKNLIKEGFITSSVIGETDEKEKYKITIDNKEKKIFINDNQIKKIEDYISNISVVIFCPDDIEILKGSPQERRKLLNIAIGQISKKYLRLLGDYNYILKQRNSYLKNQKRIDENYFKILTDKLIEIGNLIYEYRKKYINKINDIVPTVYKKIGNQDGYKIKYLCSIEEENYLENLKAEFKKKKQQEFKLGITLCGPHRDDIVFELNGQSLKEYGSQGQQRIAILSFKISELEILLGEKQQKPILLLDDVFSELDDKKKNNILSYINDNVQTFITTTNITKISKKIIGKANLYKIEEGKIKMIDKVK